MTTIDISDEDVFVLPLSFAQQRLWFFDRLSPGSAIYNVPGGVQFNGALNLEALEQSFNEIVRRHEVLRTTFTIVDGQPVQVVAPAPTGTARGRHYLLDVVDLSYLPENERQTKAQQLATREARQPFNLERGPLLRVKLLRFGEQEYVFLMTIHHIISDGWSLGVFMYELIQLYDAFCLGLPSPLPELPIQYADYAIWQQQWLEGEIMASQLSFWQQQLGGSSQTLELLADRSRPAVQSFRGANQPLTLSPTLVEKLKALSRREGVTLFTILLAAFNILLYRYTGQEDILVGSPIAGRQYPDLEKLIGFFVNTIVVRTDLAGNPSFKQLLHRVWETTFGAFANQELPFEKLVEALQPERSLSKNPLFQVMFVLQNVNMPSLDSRWSVTQLDFDTGATQFDLTLALEERHDRIVGGFIYNTDLFDADTMTRMAGHFQTLLESIVAHPEQRICELSLLTEREHQQLLLWNNTQADYPLNACIHHLFEAWVEQTPDAVALIFEDEELTYRELNAKANQLAHYLISFGVKAEELVGICVDRSVEMIIGILGILKAGGAYVPLDPAYPQERLAFMLEDAGVSVLLTQASLLATLPKHKARVFCLDKDWQEVALQSEENPSLELTPNHLAYVIYTSGSTGKPKGVLIEHLGLCNLVTAQIDLFDVRSNSRILQFASPSFDASIWEIVMALGSGATLVMGTRESLMPGQALLRLLREKEITIVTLPPSALAVLPSEELPVLRSIVVAGESCSPEIVARWAKGRRFFNAYGPTETTVCATVAECTPFDKKLSIGRAIANSQVYILDTHLQPVPIGVPGEIYIGGVGLARGYLNRPDLTAKKFIANPFLDNSEFNSKLYKTGDFARYLPDGNIEYLGRIDNQVKIRGFRIETLEIEALLKQHPDIEQAAVIAREDIPGDKRLIAYVVSKLMPDRVPYQRECSIEFDGNTAVKLQTEDISIGGVCLVGISDIVAGKRLRLHFTLPGSHEAIWLWGKVAWQKGKQAGIQFELNPSEQAILKKSLDYLLETQGFLKVLQRTAVESLRSFLKQKLPDYMVPSSFVFLNELPLTPNGKVDRKSLPAPEHLRSDLSANYVPPQTEIEQTIAKVWQAVLQTDKVGMNDNFFDLGGHSLRMAQVHNKLQEVLHKELSLVELFKYPTIGALAKYLSPEPSHTKADQMNGFNGSPLQQSINRAKQQKEAIDRQKQRLQVRINNNG
ncbi:amino acid adenylation domain-containing protein [Aerosakkonema sp. BLCC-F183]|uniref:amino acid adenylation domain-containing protein n=1 Tax=Aerosakkonema sp. BLCC-F183 TaxID=3342834 RepID=UPI0035BB09AD